MAHQLRSVAAGEEPTPQMRQNAAVLLTRIPSANDALAALPRVQLRRVLVNVQVLGRNAHLANFPDYSWAGFALFQVGSIYAVAGDLESAVTALDAFVGTFSGDPNRPAAIELLIAVHRERGDSQGSLATLDLLERESKAPLDRARVERARSELYRRSNLLAQAGVHIRNAVRILEKARGGSRPKLVQVIDEQLRRARWVQAEIDLARGRTKRAESGFELLVKEFEDLGERAIAGQLRLAKAEAQHQWERENPSADVRSITTLDRLLSSVALPRELRQRALSDIVRHSLFHKDLERSGRYVGELAGIEFANVVEECVAAGILVRYARMAGEVPDVARLERAVRALRAEWLSQPLRLGGRSLLLGQQTQLPFAELVAHRLRVDGPEAALQELISLQETSTLARRAGGTGVTVAQLQAVVPEDGGVIAFLPGPFETYVFAVDREAVVCVRLGGGLALEARHPALLRLAKPFVSTLSTHPEVLRKNPALVERVRASGAAVRDVLLPEEIRARMTGWRSVAIVGADLVGGVPFEALPWTDGALLGEAVAVATWPSIPLVVARCTKGAVRDGDAVMFACTAPDLGDEPVAAKAAGGKAFRPEPFPAQLLKPFGELLGSEAVHADAGSSKAEVLRTIRPSTRLLHLVAHGVRRRAEIASGVALRDGVLWPEDVAARTFAGTVILSSCSTGRGATRVGEGTVLATLGGAFLWAGARAVVLPVTEVPLEPHLEFMRRTHAAMANGVMPAEALRRARAALAVEGGGADGGMVERITRALVQLHGVGHATPRAR